MRNLAPRGGPLERVRSGPVGICPFSRQGVAVCAILDDRGATPPRGHDLGVESERCKRGNIRAPRRVVPGRIPNSDIVCGFGRATKRMAQLPEDAVVQVARRSNLW